MTVFIIDDEEIILQTLAAVFKRRGIEAETEADPVEAVKRFEQGNYKVVLVDVLMPGMKGVEVIRRIKRLKPLTNVIVMTAFSNMAHVVECIEAGAVDYVTKPFTDFGLIVDVVSTTIERVCRWSRSFGVEQAGRFADECPGRESAAAAPSQS